MNPWNRSYAQRSDLSQSTPWYIEELQRVIDRLPQEGLVVDFACNTAKTVTRALKQKPNLKFIGIDVNEVALDMARKKNPTAEFYTTLEGVADDSVDAVVFSHAITQVQDLEGVLSEIWRVLKPGGKIHVVIYNRWNDYARRLMNIWKGYQSDPTICRSFDQRSLFETMRRAGFGLDEQYKWGKGWPKPRLFFHGYKPE